MAETLRSASLRSPNGRWRKPGSSAEFATSRREFSIRVAGDFDKAHSRDGRYRDERYDPRHESEVENASVIFSRSFVSRSPAFAIS